MQTVRLRKITIELCRSLPD